MYTTGRLKTTEYIYAIPLNHVEEYNVAAISIIAKKMFYT